MQQAEVQISANVQRLLDAHAAKIHEEYDARIGGIRKEVEELAAEVDTLRTQMLEDDLTYDDNPKLDSFATSRQKIRAGIKFRGYGRDHIVADGRTGEADVEP